MVARDICFIRIFVVFNLKRKSIYRDYSRLRISHLLCQFQNQSFGVLPAKARIGDGFAVHAAVGGLRALFDVRLYHKPFDDCVYILLLAHAVQHFFCDTRLLEKSFCGV